MDHLSQAKLRQMLEDAAELVQVNGLYTHYKGQSYKVKDLVIREEDSAVLVIYEAQYEEHIIFARPLSNWLEQIEWHGKTKPRFALIEK
jgi:hypothetical protein